MPLLDQSTGGPDWTFQMPFTNQPPTSRLPHVPTLENSGLPLPNGSS